MSEMATASDSFGTRFRFLGDTAARLCRGRHRCRFAATTPGVGSVADGA